MEHEILELTAGLRYHCPNCGAVEADDLDLLSTGSAYEVTCDICQGHFQLAVLECEHCCNETACTWLAEPPPGPAKLLTCEACGKPLLDHEIPVRSLGDS